MATDFFLEIDGIKGESADTKHKDTIDIESYSFGVSQVGGFAYGGGGGAGKASFQDFHFTQKINKATPLLLEACATGTHIKKAVLFVRKAGGTQQDYLTVTFSDVLISSYQTGAHGGGDPVPTEQISFNFSKIEFEYKPQKADGSLDGAIKKGYDLKANKKV